MNKEELINEIYELLLQLGDLQKKDMQGTRHLPKFNEADAQIVILKFHADADEGEIHDNEILPTVEQLLKSTWNELKSELPKMMPEEHIDAAMELHAKIKTDLEALKQQITGAEPQRLGM